jgi:hypothetical protein
LTNPFQLRLPSRVQIATTHRPFRRQVVVFTCTRSIRSSSTSAIMSTFALCPSGSQILVALAVEPLHRRKLADIALRAR